MANEWSQAALSVCIVCDLVWCVVILGACTYLVFWMDQSGAWYVLAIFLASSWNCKSYRSPAQIAADTKDEK